MVVISAAYCRYSRRIFLSGELFFLRSCPQLTEILYKLWQSFRFHFSPCYLSSIFSQWSCEGTCIDRHVSGMWVKFAWDGWCLEEASGRFVGGCLGRCHFNSVLSPPWLDQGETGSKRWTQVSPFLPQPQTRLPLFVCHGGSDQAWQIMYISNIFCTLTLFAPQGLQSATPFLQARFVTNMTSVHIIARNLTWCGHRGFKIQKLSSKNRSKHCANFLFLSIPLSNT